MELLSQKVNVGNLTIEICVHDLSHRMGLPENETHKDHLFVNLVARDAFGARVWSTAILAEDGKVQPYSTVSEALADARRRIMESTELFTPDNPAY
jgi:hypothetical protein